MLLWPRSPAFLRGNGSSGPVERHGRLSTAGGHLRSAAGHPVALRGVSLFWDDLQPRFSNCNVVRWLVRDWKIDILRIPIGTALAPGRTPPPDQIKRVFNLIDAAIEAGIYVIVDWHTHVPSTSEAVSCLSLLAAQYGDIPNLLYETWNEPLPQHSWGGCIKEHHMRVAAAVRKAAPGAVIIAGTRNYCQRVDEAAEDPLQTENVLYALHFYAASHREGLRRRAEAAIACGLPLIVSEWGTCESNGGGLIDLDESDRWWEFMEANRLSSACWAISDRDETSAALRPRAASGGNWGHRDLSGTGRYVRGKLRRAGRSSRREELPLN